MTTESNTIEYWKDKIQAAYDANDESLTKSLVEQALHETESAPELLEIAGMIAYTRGDSEQASQLIEAAMFEITLSFSGQLTLANAWIHLGNDSAARTTLLFLVEMIERVPCSLLPGLTHALSKIEQNEAALTVCQVAFKRHPSNHNAIFGAAFYMHRSGAPVEQVYEALWTTIDLAPDVPLYRLNLAAVCCSLDRWDEAYSHACRIPKDGLKSIPCGCLQKKMKELFTRKDDGDRLALVSGRPEPEDES